MRFADTDEDITVKEKILLCLCMLACMIAVAGCALSKSNDKTDTGQGSVSAENAVTSYYATERYSEIIPVTDNPVSEPETFVSTDTEPPETKDVLTETETVQSSKPIPEYVRQPLVSREPLRTIGWPEVIVPQPPLPETKAPETKPKETVPETAKETDPIETAETEKETEPSETEPSETIEDGQETEPPETPGEGTETVPETVPETIPETVPETIPETVPETIPETVPETEPIKEPEPVRLKVVKRSDASENLVFHDFYMAGVGCSILYETSAAVPYGHVISVEFSGKEDDTYYYVDYGTKATLHVSTALGGDLSQYNDRIVYLTFDDGPCAYTGEVLNVLASYNAKATFFTVGNSMEQFPKQTRAIYAAGHAIGCHSYSHEFKEVYRDNAALVREVYRWEDAVSSVLGGMLPYKLFRFPGGTTTSFLNDRVRTYCKEDLNALGYLSFDWSMATNDAWFAEKPAEQPMEDWLKSSLQTTLHGIEAWHPDRIRICLMHETNGKTRETLPWVLDYLSQKGYTFRTLDRVNQSWLFR